MFGAVMNKGLRGQVVIAFRSNSYCFWEIWAVMGSIPLSGTWFFFFVQINYFKFFLYACISYNDIKESELLSNLSKITINFWTLCTAPKCNPKRPRICINWNPPFQTSLHNIFKNCFLLSKCCFTMLSFRGIFTKGPFLYYVRVSLAFFRPPTHPCKE